MFAPTTTPTQPDATLQSAPPAPRAQQPRSVAPKAPAREDKLSTSSPDSAKDPSPARSGEATFASSFERVVRRGNPSSERTDAPIETPVAPETPVVQPENAPEQASAEPQQHGGATDSQPATPVVVSVPVGCPSRRTPKRPSTRRARPAQPIERTEPARDTPSRATPSRHDSADSSDTADAPRPAPTRAQATTAPQPAPSFTQPAVPPSITEGVETGEPTDAPPPEHRTPGAPRRVAPGSGAPTPDRHQQSEIETVDPRSERAIRPAAQGAPATPAPERENSAPPERARADAATTDEHDEAIVARQAGEARSRRTLAECLSADRWAERASFTPVAEDRPPHDARNAAHGASPATVATPSVAEAQQAAADGRQGRSDDRPRDDSRRIGGGRAEPAKPVAEQPTQQTAQPTNSQAASVDARSAGEIRANAANPAQQGASLTGQGQSAEADDAALASIHRGLSVALRQQGGSVQMRLTPESLGLLKIEMTLSRGAATLQASTPEARELLSRSIETLRASLEAKGLSVERLSITLAPASHGGLSGQHSGTNTGAQQHQQAGAQHSQQGDADAEHDASGERSKGWFEREQRRSNTRQADDAPEPDERLFRYRFGLHAIG